MNRDTYNILRDYHLIFPRKPKGQTVLDLTCRNGYFCIKAAQAGAALVLGLDRDQENIAIARNHASINQLPNVFFEVGDAETFQSLESYDVVLCLDVPRGKHTILRTTALLKKIAELARKRIVFSVDKHAFDLLAWDFGDLWPECRIEVQPFGPDCNLIAVDKPTEKS